MHSCGGTHFQSLVLFNLLIYFVGQREKIYVTNNAYSIFYEETGDTKIHL